MKIKVGSRASKLALKQVEEVYDALKMHHPEILFDFRCAHSKGDLDQKTSLKSLGATNFFTDVLDQWVLKGQCQVAIHSAKDLPDPLPKGLKVVAITACKNNQDVLVLKEGLNLSKVDKPLKIGCSSTRREEAVTKVYPESQFVDLRGTIEKRLSYLKQDLDGVVIAKVALMRLGLTHLNWIDLQAKTHPLQGSLAIVAKEGDLEMEAFFSCIDFRQNKKTLFLGLDASRFLSYGPVDHRPIIELRALKWSAKDKTKWSQSSHLIITSSKAPQILVQSLLNFGYTLDQIKQKKVLAIGNQTKKACEQVGLEVEYVSLGESQEGLIELFEKKPFLKKNTYFYPRSKKARPVLYEFLTNQAIKVHKMDLYDVHAKKDFAISSLREYSKIYFTSPSCVKAFFSLNLNCPPKMEWGALGPVTLRELKSQEAESKLVVK